MPFRPANVSTIAAEKFNGEIRTRRVDVAVAGNTELLPGWRDGRRIISMTISVSDTAEEAEIFVGENRNQDTVKAGGFFGANGGLQDDSGSAGNGVRIPPNTRLMAYNAAGNPVKFIVKYTNDVYRGSI